MILQMLMMWKGDLYDPCLVSASVRPMWIFFYQKKSLINFVYFIFRKGKLDPTPKHNYVTVITVEIVAPLFSLHSILVAIRGRYTIKVCQAGSLFEVITMAQRFGWSFRWRGRRGSFRMWISSLTVTLKTAMRLSISTFQTARREDNTVQNSQPLQTSW